MKSYATALAPILANYYNMDLAGVEQFVAGVIYGLIQKDDLPEIQKCLKNGETLEVEITNAISDFSKGDLQDMIKAVQELGQIVQELPRDLDDCKSIQGDIEKIENWAKIFTNPVALVMTLTKNLLANWKDVQADVSKVTTDWNNEDYYNAGEDVADTVILAVGPIDGSDDVDADIDWELLQSHLAENMNKLFLW